MSQQGLRQASVRAVTATTLDYNGDWHALFDNEGIAAGTFNERMLSYINDRLGTSYTNVNSAMAAMAADEGVTRFTDIGTFSAPNLVSEEFVLTSAVPSGWTYTGGSATSTYRDSNGKLALGSANTARFHHTSAGVPLGYMSEEARTNLCTNTNVNPADASGFTTTGTAAVVRLSDTTALAAAGLENVCTNGTMLSLQGGASGGTVSIDGTTGATGAFSVSFYGYALGGVPGASFGITPSPTAVSVPLTASPVLYKAENLTATASTDKMIFTLPAFTQVRIILNQLEAGKFCTSIIKIAGATATRSADVLKLASGLETQPWWNLSQGTIIVSVNPYASVDQANNGGIFVAGSTGSFPTDALYVQTNSSSNKANGFVKATSSGNISVPTGIVAGRKTPVGITWERGTSITAFAGPMIFNTLASVLTPSNLVQFVLGSFASGTLQLNGTIDRLTIINRSLPLSQIAPYAMGSGVGISERAIIGGGQSNMEGYFQSASTLVCDGEVVFDSILDSVWGTSTRNWVINGSTAGTSFTVWQGSGSAITRWKTIASAYMASGGTIEAILWDQGETDLGYSTAAYKAGILGIFQDMQSHIGNTLEGDYVPVIIVPMGRYRFGASQTNDDNVAKIKQAQQELARDYSWIYLAPEKVQQPLVDNIVHLSRAGYASQAALVMRKTLDVLGESISGGVDGPEITAISRSGSTVTVTITHDGGTDFTPTSSIGGFRFYDGTTSTEIAVSAAVRTNATTITLTLASTPSNATQILRYSFDQNYNTADTACVVDNQATYPCPLRSAEWRSANTGATWANVV